MGERIMGKEVRRRIMNFRHIEEKLVFQDVLPRRSQNRENPVILVISGNETDSTQYPEKIGNYDLVYRSLKDTTPPRCATSDSLKKSITTDMTRNQSE